MSSKILLLVVTDQKLAFKQLYTYPDRDFCFFSDFPHERLVYPIIESDLDLECTCTLLWLIQYSRDFVTYEYRDFLNVYGESQRCIFDPDQFYQHMAACDFNKKLQNCHNKSAHATKNVGILFETNLYYAYKWLQYLLEVVFQPMLCVLGILTNTLTILIIRNKSDLHLSKNFKNIMYKHIVANSALNIVFCAIRLLSLVNICIFPQTSYCSAVYRSSASQHLKIYAINFVGNAVRLCSNMSYIAYSISRYYLSTSNPSKIFKRFKNLNVKALYSLAFLACLALSSFKLFQYEVNEFEGGFDPNYPFDVYAPIYCNAWLKEMKLVFTRVFTKCRLFAVLNMANNILNNIVFVFVSVCIDVGLVRFTNENIKRKKIMFPALCHMVSPSLDHALNLKEKVNKMIITNGLLYFVSHAPEFVVNVLLLVFNRRVAQHCFNRFSCVELLEMARVFNFWSISLQFFVFLHFDTNFKHSIQVICGRKKV